MKRFFDKVDIRGPNDCWLWTAYCNDGGYGIFRVSGKSEKAHRFSYELHKGPIPEGMDILHSCHTRPCVNPLHLRTGTHQDNMDDMIEAGRQPNNEGEYNPAHKLTKQEVFKIRELLTTDMFQFQIAERFNVSRTAISRINKSKTWSHL